MIKIIKKLLGLKIEEKEIIPEGYYKGGRFCTNCCKYYEPIVKIGTMLDETRCTHCGVTLKEWQQRLYR